MLWSVTEARFQTKCGGEWNGRLCTWQGKTEKTRGRKPSLHLPQPDGKCRVVPSSSPNDCEPNHLNGPNYDAVVG